MEEQELEELGDYFDSEVDSEDSVDEMKEDELASLPIKQHEADANMEKVGEEVEEDTFTVTKENMKTKYPESFSKESEEALQAVLDEIKLPFDLTAFQIVAVNSLLNGRDLFCIVPTGSGKMAVSYLFILALRKMPEGWMGSAPGISKSMLLVAVPLKFIMIQQMTNIFCPAASLSMGGELRDTVLQPVGESEFTVQNVGEAARSPITEEDLLNGAIPVLFVHNEALGSSKGRAFCRKAKARGLLRGIALEEGHQGLEGHWLKFRPEMVFAVFSAVVFLVPGSPISILTATLTAKEKEDLLRSMGRRPRPPITIAEGPIQQHHKVCFLRRPSSQSPLQGRYNPSTDHHDPGLLHLLRVLCLDKFVDAVKSGKPYKEFPKTMIFFKSSDHMMMINSWLYQQTGYSTCDESPYVMNHATVADTDQAFMLVRSGEILMWLTTNRMLLGGDLRDIDMILMVQPPNMPHAVMQAIGRSGRKLQSGRRRRSLTYVLFNSQDLGGNVTDMTEEVRKLCLTQGVCRKKIMREIFLGDYSVPLTEGVVMKDPAGFVRIEMLGKAPIYMTIPQPGVMATPRKLWKPSEVREFLAEQQGKGMYLGVYVQDFDFTKRGVKRKSRAKKDGKQPEKLAKMSEVFDSSVLSEEEKDDDEEPARTAGGSKFNAANLLRAGVKLDHKAVLQEAAGILDNLRLLKEDPQFEAAKLAELKIQLDNETTLAGMVDVLGGCEEALLQMGRVIEDRALEEMLSLSSTEGPLPLKDWPNNLKNNWFSDVARFGVIHSPLTMSFILRLVVKEKQNNITPRNVVDISTIYAQLAYQVDKTNSSLAKLNTLQLKMDNMSDEGIDAQAKMGLAQTARSLRNMRDQMAEVQDDLLVEQSGDNPDTFTLDNCDQKQEHTTVEYLERERQDTRHLPIDSMPPEEVAKLFSISQLTMENPELVEEKSQLDKVLAIGMGRLLAERRPGTAGKLKSFLKEHHQHKWSHLPVKEALITLLSPHYYQETVISQMIQLAETLQKEKLMRLKKQRANDLAFHDALEEVYKEVAPTETTEAKTKRLDAEHVVEMTVLEHGEPVGHGDLLTFQKFLAATLMRVGSVRAVDRLAYLGIFRMELFHMCMSKDAQDIKSAMPDTKDLVSEGSLGNAAATIGINGWFSNQKKKVVKCGNYERHSQHLREWQTSLFLNLYDNYMMVNKTSMDAVVDSNTAEKFVLDMLLEAGALWYWNPNYDDPQKEFHCSLFRGSRDQVIRLCLGTVFRQSEKENDSVALRALRRVMVPYFLNKSKSQTSKYGRYTLLDLIVFLSSSERSQTRMEHMETVNPSGTRGGGMFRDKYNEVLVRVVKEALKRQHSALRDLQIQTMIKSLNIMTEIHEHNLRSRLFMTAGRQSSKDTVGQERRDMLEELAREADPFNRTRTPVTDFVSNFPGGSPFAGLTTPSLERFVISVKQDFMLLYPKLSTKPIRRARRSFQRLRMGRKACQQCSACLSPDCRECNVCRRRQAGGKDPGKVCNLRKCLVLRGLAEIVEGVATLSSGGGDCSGAVAQVGSTGQDGRHRDEEEAGAKDIYYPAPSSSAGAAENGQLGDIEDSERVQEVDSVHEEIGDRLLEASPEVLVDSAPVQQLLVPDLLVATKKRKQAVQKKPEKKQKLLAQRIHLTSVEEHLIEEIKDAAGLAGKKYRCKKCKKVGGERLRMVGHASSCGQKKTARKRGPNKTTDICNSCPFKATLSKVMKIHRRVHHPSSSTHRYRCSRCPKTLKNVKTLHQHKALHVKKPKFRCPECKKIFSHLGTRNRHLGVHRLKVSMVTSEAQAREHENAEVEVITGDTMEKEQEEEQLMWATEEQRHFWDSQNDSNTAGLTSQQIQRNINVEALTEGLLNYLRRMGEPEDYLARVQAELNTRLCVEPPSRQKASAQVRPGCSNPVVLEEEEMVNIMLPGCLLAPGTRLFVVPSASTSGGDAYTSGVDASTQVNLTKARQLMSGQKEDTVYSCDMCEYTTSKDRWNLQRHKKKKHESSENPFICDRYWCREGFDTRYQKEVHMKKCYKDCPVPSCSKSGMVWREKVESHARYHETQARLQEQLLAACRAVAGAVAGAEDQGLQSAVVRSDGGEGSESNSGGLWEVEPWGAVVAGRQQGGHSQPGSSSALEQPYLGAGGSSSNSLDMDLSDYEVNSDPEI